MKQNKRLKYKVGRLKSERFLLVDYERGQNFKVYSPPLKPKQAPGHKHQGRHSLPGKVSTAHGLEGDDDVGDLEVPLLLQVGQDPGPEEDLTLADPEQIGVQLQGSDL